MRKLLAFTLLPLLLVGCKNKEKESQNKFTILTYCYSYQTSEVQDYTHDCRLAKFRDIKSIECYVEVPQDYNEDTVEVSYTGKKIFYRVYYVDVKVSNNGWEVKQTW